MKMKGAEAMSNKLRRFQAQFPQKVKAALFIETEIETTEAKKRTPVWTGPTGPGYPIPGLLRASVHTEGPFQQGNRIWAMIVAGGAAGAYAWRQHEELEWFHTVGQAKYIESVIMESRPFILNRVAVRLKFAKMLQ